MKRWTALLLTTVLASPAIAQQPEGMVVQHGAASASYDDATRTQTINQTTGKAVYQWDSFNIGAGETTHFQMPSANGIALNRTLQNDPSQIFGTLSSNGEVILLNPHGVLFGEGSRVDVNGLMVSTGEIDDADFLDGDRRFDLTGIDANPNAAIVNEGALTMREGGWASLVAPRVENNGVISAPMGRVALGSGSHAEVDLTGDGLIRFRAPLTQTPDGAEALVTNRGLIETQGGTVHLTADAVEGVVENVINLEHHEAANRGRIEGGKLILSGGGHGIVRVAGEIDARNEGTGETGGRVVVTGQLIDVRETAKIDASGHAGGGEILIGGDLQGRQAEALNQTYDNAEGVRVEGGAEIIANALNVGDGGRIIVWSDGVTGLAANLAARGGQNAGDGGFIEVSGRQELVYWGRADLRAPHGDVGTLLLDPTDILIVAGAVGGSTGTLTLGPTIDDTASNVTTLTTGDLLNQLLLSDVIVTTDSLLGANGNITIQDDLIFTGTADRSLQFLANREINVSNNVEISSANARLNVDFQAVNDVTLGAGVEVRTNGGDFSRSKSSLTGVATQGFDMDATALIETSGGNIFIETDKTGNNTISNLNSASGNIKVQQSSTDFSNSIITGNIITTSGNIEIRASRFVDINSGANIQSASGDISVQSSWSTVSGVVMPQGSTNIDGAVSSLSGNILISAKDISIGAGASLAGGGSLTMTGSDPNIDISVASPAAGFQVSAAELSQISDGFSAVQFGDDTLTSTTTVGSYSFSDAATFIGGSVDASGATITIAADGSGGQTAGFVSTQGAVNLAGANLSYTGGETLTLQSGTVSGTGNALLGGASINTNGAAVTAALNGDAALGALDTGGGEATIAATGNLTVAALTTAGGDAALSADSNMTGAGTLTNTGTIDVGAGDLSLSGANVDLTGGADTVKSTGDVAVSPSTAAATVGIAGGAGAFQFDGADLAAIEQGVASLSVGRADASGLTSVGAYTFRDPAIIIGGSGGMELSTVRTTGETLTLTTAGGISSAVPIIVDTTNSGGSPLGADIDILAAIDGGGLDLTVDAGASGQADLNGAVSNIVNAAVTAQTTTIATGLDATAITFSGQNVSGVSVDATTIDVQNTVGANLFGTVDSLGGRDAALSSNLVMTNASAFTFNGFTKAGVMPTTGASTSSLPALPVVHFDDDFFRSLTEEFDDLIVVDYRGEDAIETILANQEDVGLDGFDDAALGVRRANDLAALGDDALLNTDRPGLVGQILDALDRSNLDETGAPIGPYAERTAILPGLLVYDPDEGVRRLDAGVADSIRPPILGGLAGW